MINNEDYAAISKYAECTKISNDERVGQLLNDLHLKGQNICESINQDLRNWIEFQPKIRELIESISFDDEAIKNYITWDGTFESLNIDKGQRISKPDDTQSELLFLSYNEVLQEYTVSKKDFNSIGKHAHFDVFHDEVKIDLVRAVCKSILESILEAIPKAQKSKLPKLEELATKEEYKLILRAKENLIHLLTSDWKKIAFIVLLFDVFTFQEDLRFYAASVKERNKIFDTGLKLKIRSQINRNCESIHSSKCEEFKQEMKSKLMNAKLII
mgnify:CR=1 FL=1